MLVGLRLRTAIPVLSKTPQTRLNWYIPVPLEDAGFSVQLESLNQAQLEGNEESFSKVATQCKLSS